MNKETMHEKNKKNLIRIIRAGMILSGILFIILGIIREEHRAVLLKAIRICLECIGIG